MEVVNSFIPLQPCIWKIECVALNLSTIIIVLILKNNEYHMNKSVNCEYNRMIKNAI